MHSRKNEEPEEFKVVDRRLFTSEGELRTDLPPETAAPEAPPKPSPSISPSSQASPSQAPPSQTKDPEPKPTSATASAPSPAAAPDTPGGEQAKEPPISQPADSETASSQPGAGEVVQFQHLIMSLVSSAMYQLGMAARPGEVAPPPDLPGARETIDILAVLAQKTKGNLTREEEELLTGSLQELRLAFVELSRRAGRIR